MTELAVGMVADGTRALLGSDAALADSVTTRDLPLDRFDIALETEAMRLIATLQPEGPDLRTVGAVLKIANCLDRVGRLGYDLARNRTTAPDPGDPMPTDLLRQMDERARAMVHRAVTAFLQGDAAAAKTVFALDDDVDDLHEQLQSRVFALLPQGGRADGAARALPPCRPTPRTRRGQRVQDRREGSLRDHRRTATRVLPRARPPRDGRGPTCRERPRTFPLRTNASGELAAARQSSLPRPPRFRTGDRGHAPVV
ncbi:MAG: phosphate signaling complex PhoU family protein [Thermoplasmata archaeon]